MDENNPLRDSMRTGTLLDTSSDSDMDENPVAFTADLINNLAKKEEPAKQKASMIPRTQMLPKGRVNQADLLQELVEVDQPQMSMTSHALPKGQIKLSQLNKGQQRQDGKNKRITSMDLLTGLATTSVARVPQPIIAEVEENDDEEYEARLKQEFLDFKKKNEGSRIGGGALSPMRNKPTEQQAARSGSIPSFGAHVKPMKKSGTRKASTSPSIKARGGAEESKKPTKSRSPAKHGIPGISPKSKGGTVGQSMFGGGSYTAGRTSSKIGQGASKVGMGASRPTAISPPRRAVNNSDHFGTSISPVNKDRIKSSRERPTSSRPTSSRPTSSRPTSSRPTSSKPTSSRPTSSALHADFMKIDSMMPFGASTVKDTQLEEPLSQYQPIEEKQAETSPSKAELSEEKVPSEVHFSKQDDDDSMQIGPPLYDESTSQLPSLDEQDHEQLLLQEPEDSNDAVPLEVFGDQSSLHSESEHLHLQESLPEKIVRKAEPVMETVHENVTVYDVAVESEDLLELARLINRRLRSDIINSVQKELEDMEAAMNENPHMLVPNAKFDLDVDFTKYRPGMLADWDFEIRQIEPRAKINIEKFENETLDAEQVDFQDFDEIDDFAQRPPKSDGSDSDDLLKTLEHRKVSDQIKQADTLFIEEDSPSHVLPVPLGQRDEHPPSKTNPFFQLNSMGAGGHNTSDPSLMSEKETMDHLAREKLEKNAQLYQYGDLDAITEGDEDLFSQMHRLGDESGRESIMYPRGSIAGSPADMIDQISHDQRRSNHQSNRQNRRHKQQFKSHDFGAQRLQSTSLVTELIKPGQESLAQRESKRPRSSSLKGRNGGAGEGDLFDADSDMFSALNPSNSEVSSINLSNRDEDSPMREPRLEELDIDDLDSSQINLLPMNEKFARLVKQSKIDKEERDNRPISFHVDNIEDEPEIKGNSNLRDSKNFLLGELPKPMQKPRSKSEEENQRKELRNLITYTIQDNQGKEETFIDTIPTKGKIMTHNSTSFEATISTNSLLSLLLADSSLKKARTAHLYLCEDRELSKSRIALKSLYEQLAKQGDMLTAAFVLLKMAKVYFCLNQLNNAVTTISHAVDAILRQPGVKPPADAIFWKGLIYFYSIFTKRAQSGQRKPSAQRKSEAQQDLSKMIASCETSLLSAADDPQFKICASFLLIKLSHFVIRERFGCDLVCVTKSDPNRICENIRKVDAYYGAIAQSELFVDGKQKNIDLAKSTLENAIRQSPGRGEAYIKLWQLHMYQGNELMRSQSQQQLEDQRHQTRAGSSADLNASARRSNRLSSQSDLSMGSSQMDEDMESLAQSQRTSTDLSGLSLDNSNRADRAKQHYQQAYEVISTRLLQNCDESFASPPQQRVLLTFLTVKALQKSGQYIQAFELLQREFSENPQIVAFMYLYGKYVVKAMASEVHTQLSQFALQLEGLDQGAAAKKRRGRDFRIDQGYLGSGIGSLEESLRSCFKERQAKVNYYIGFAYKVLRMPLKTQEFWLKAQNLHKETRTLSYQQGTQVSKFLEEQLNFTIIADKADHMIKEKLGTVKPDPAMKNLPELARKNIVKSFVHSIKMMERIDRANSLLFQARLDGYVVEATSEDTNYGQAFNRLLDTFPTFIDGYIHHWHYLKWRLATLTQQSDTVLMGVKKPKHAGQIKDGSGKLLLDMMRTCAENALQYCDATEVPTSLWVEARIIYAKQMIFDKEIGQAIRVLKDISYIIPPYPIEGLSYVQTLEQEEEPSQDNSDLLRTTESAVNDQSAEDIYRRNADMAKARNGPLGKQVYKAAPQFQKVRYNAGAEGSTRSNALPKGKVDLQVLTKMERDEVNANAPKSEQFPKGVFPGNTKQSGRTESMPCINIEDTDMFAQMDKVDANFNASESMVQQRQQPGSLMTILEEEESRQNRSSAIPSVFEEQKSAHMADAQNLLDRISDMNKRPAQGQAANLNNTGGPRASNRMSMYRRPTQGQAALRASGNASMHIKNRDSAKRSMTIYNPFSFNKEITDGKHGKKIREVSMSLEGPLITNNVKAPTGGQMRNEQLELAYQAMVKVQQAWQEQNQRMNNADARSSTQFDDSQSQVMSEFRQDNINDSENFAIYSNFKFLQLIGKFCAKSKQYSDEGLKALNDYLLLIEYQRSSYTKEEYYDERAITIFYIGSIFYNCRDYFHAVEHLLPIQEQLHNGKHYKELSQSERKISKIWRLNFNEKAIKWDYFSDQNQQNFKALEVDRQAAQKKRQLARAQTKKPVKSGQTQIHKLHH